MQTRALDDIAVMTVTDLEAAVEAEYVKLGELLNKHGVDSKGPIIYFGADGDYLLPRAIGGDWILIEDCNKAKSHGEDTLCKIYPHDMESFKRNISARVRHIPHDCEFKPDMAPALVVYRKDRSDYAFSVGAYLLSKTPFILTDDDLSFELHQVKGKEPTIIKPIVTATMPENVMNAVDISIPQMPPVSKKLYLY